MTMGKVCLSQCEGSVRGAAVRRDHGESRGAWHRFTCTAQETQDLNFCLISALGCRILASCDGFPGLSWTGSWVLSHGLHAWAL